MKHYVGIDIGKSRLDVYVENHYFYVSNTDTGFQELMKKLKPLKETILMVDEPTGGYEAHFVKTFRAAGYGLHSAHANHVRNFARSTGRHAKTDKIDCKVIQAYGALMQVQPEEIYASEATEQLRALLQRRNELVHIKNQEKNRLETGSAGERGSSIKSHIAWIEEEKKRIEKEIDVLSGKESMLREKNELLTSIKGLGDLVANTLIAFVPELGKINHKSLTALVGLAPYNHDSGKHRGRRYICAGRGHVRKLLYMSALRAIRYNTDLQVFYTRLRSQGKPGKVAIVAVMRKLLIMANTVVKRGSPWEEKMVNFA